MTAIMDNTIINKSLERLRERAAAEGLLDVAYATPTRPSGRCCWRGRRGGWCGSRCRARTSTRRWSTWPSGSRRGSSRRPAGSTRSGGSSRTTSRAAAGSSRCRSTGSSATASCSAPAKGSRRSPTARPAPTRPRPGGGQRARGPRRRLGLLAQSDPARRPLPPGGAQRRQLRPLRGRRRDEEAAARNGEQSG